MEILWDGERVEYHLTKAGSDLLGVVIKLGDWGQTWVNHDIGIEDVDPTLLVWEIHRRVNMSFSRKTGSWCS